MLPLTIRARHEPPLSGSEQKRKKGTMDKSARIANLAREILRLSEQTETRTAPAVRQAKSPQYLDSIDVFLEDNGGVATVSEMAALLDADEGAVRRWARDNGVRRCGATFVFAAEAAREIADEFSDDEDDDLDDESEEDAGSDDGDLDNAVND